MPSLVTYCRLCSSVHGQDEVTEELDDMEYDNTFLTPELDTILNNKYNLTHIYRNRSMALKKSK